MSVRPDVERGAATAGFEPDPQTRLVAGRLVQLGQIGDHRADVDPRHGVGDRARFHARDRQQGVERLDQIVRLFDDALQRIVKGWLAAWVAQRRLRPVAQPCQRRLQIVRDIVGHFAQAAEQLLDPLQHLVHIARQPVDLVMRALERQPAGQIAGHDPLARGCHLVNAAQNVAGNPKRADEADERDEPKPDQENPAHAVRELALFFDVAANQQRGAAGHLDRHADRHSMFWRCAPAIASFIAGMQGQGSQVAKHAAVRLVTQCLGPLAEIASKLLPGGVDQQVEAVAGLPAALGHRLRQQAGAAELILLAQTPHLGRDHLQHLAGQQIVGAPENRADHDHGGQRKQREERQKQPQRGGCEQFTQRCHGSRTRRRAPYAGGDA